MHPEDIDPYKHDAMFVTNHDKKSAHVAGVGKDMVWAMGSEVDRDKNWFILRRNAKVAEHSFPIRVWMSGDKSKIYYVSEPIDMFMSKQHSHVGSDDESLGWVSYLSKLPIHWWLEEMRVYRETQSISEKDEGLPKPLFMSKFNLTQDSTLCIFCISCILHLAMFA